MTFSEQLLQELAEAGGRIVKNGSGPELEKWPSRIAAARRSGRIPETKELYGGWCRGGYKIQLVDIPAPGASPPSNPPLCPPESRDSTPRPRAMQYESQPPGLTKSVHERALRPIQALIITAENEGHSQDGQLRPPSERLRFVLSDGQPHRASEWADTPTRSLEDQLAEIAQEVTLRGGAAERRRIDEIEAARQKRIRWEAAMKEARVQYAEAYRVWHFEAQQAARRHAIRLAEYVSAVRTRVETMPPGQARTQAETWID